MKHKNEDSDSDDEVETEHEEPDEKTENESPSLLQRIGSVLASPFVFIYRGEVTTFFEISGSRSKLAIA